MLVLSFLMVSLYDMNEREVRSMALNDNIKKIREEKKYTQQQLADKLYVSRQTVCRWENGSRCPDLITAKKLAMELGVTLDELISDEDITDIQSKYGIWKFDRVKEREKIQMMQKRILDFIEIIGGIFLAISLLLRVQFDMKVPAWITIICILIVTVAFLRGDGGDQLRQGSAQRHKGQGNHGFRHTQRLGDKRPVIHQQVGTNGNHRCAADEHGNAHPQRAALFGGFRFLCGGSGILETLTDGAVQIQRQQNQQTGADDVAKIAGQVGIDAVECGGGKKEKDRDFQALGVNGPGAHRNGDGGNQGGVADDGADGVAIGNLTMTADSGGGRYHHFRQGGS